MAVKIKALVGDSSAADDSAASKGSQLIYREAVDATGDAVEARNGLSDTTVKRWLEGYRKVMEGIHGKRSNDGRVSAEPLFVCPLISVLRRGAWTWSDDNFHKPG